jgi:hypothetical protein
MAVVFFGLLGKIKVFAPTNTEIKVSGSLNFNEIYQHELINLK